MCMNKTLAPSRRKALRGLVAFVVLLVLSCGCQPNHKTEKGTVNPPSTPLGSTQPTTVDIPEHLLTQGLRLMGAPFSKEIVYEVQGLASGKVLRGGRQVTEVKIEGDAVRFIQKWTGDLESLGSAEYLSNKEGVSTIKILDKPVEPPALALPPSLSEGKQWEAKYNISDMPNFGKTSVWHKFKVVKREKVTVPLGTFEAWVVEMESSFTGEFARASVHGKTWLVEGIGELKSEFTRELSTKGTTEKTTFTTVAVEQKPQNSLNIPMPHQEVKK